MNENAYMEYLQLKADIEENGYDVFQIYAKHWNIPNSEKYEVDEIDEEGVFLRAYIHGQDEVHRLALKYLLADSPEPLIKADREAFLQSQVEEQERQRKERTEQDERVERAILARLMEKYGAPDGKP